MEIAEAEIAAYGKQHQDQPCQQRCLIVEQSLKDSEKQQQTYHGKYQYGNAPACLVDPEDSHEESSGKDVQLWMVLVSFRIQRRWVSDSPG